jgi:hypothetical protein
VNFVKPDRNLLIGALAAAIVWVLAQIARQAGWEFDTGMAMAAPVLVGYVLTYVIPQTKDEVAAKVDNEVVKIAQADPTNPTDIAKVIDDKIILQAQIDPASPATIPEGETVKSLNDKLAVEKLKPEEKV